MPLDYSLQAVRHLRRCDAALQPIMKRIGPYAMSLERNRFAALTGSIISQQISIKAAAAIRQRLKDAVAPDRLSPEAIIKLRTRRLRSVGLSAAKVRYLQDLADHVTTGKVNLKSIHRHDDEAVIQRLLPVKGIGRWTAEMFLMFSLGRPDVLPADDLGLRVAIQRLDALPELPTRQEVTCRGAVWQPFRSVATWYMWQSLKA